MLPSLEPGFIHSVDRDARIVRVRIPGIFDGAEVFPEAQLLYPLGDKSEHTEIRLLEGDRVWLAFIGGDPRFPIVAGHRPKETDNVVGWRRWHHDNFQFDADGTFRVNATDVEFNATTFKVNGQTVEVNAAATTVDSTATTIKGSTAAINANISMAGPGGGAGTANISANINTTGTITNNGKNIGSDHAHSGVQPGGGNSGGVV